ncbi:MAG TPA: HAMP domain-containing sensor histidine kinase [Pseudogracilibacillus sp.]|nr:HAMP domain-containing sensor histidine kinase [Pseudogracilibacillus sp.]
MRSLYGKFLIFTVLTMVGSAIIAFLIVNTLYHQFLKSDNDAKNMTIVQEITSYIEDHPQLDLDHFLTMQAEVGYKLLLAYKEHDEVILEMYGEPFREFNLDTETIESVLKGNDYHGMRDLPKETFVTGFFADELANSVATSFKVDNQTYALFLRPNIKLLFTEVHFLLGGLLFGMGVLSIIAMLFIAHRLIIPLQQLTKATKNISAGEYFIDLPIKSRDEIGQLAEAFKKMTDELQRAERRQKQFITDVSHDLQTPLQQMKGYARLLKESELSKKEKERYLSIIEKEAERLSTLSRQLLTLTFLDISRDTLQRSSFRLDEQLKRIIERFHWQTEQKVQTIIAKLPEVTIEGNEAFYEQLWENLLSNAIKYAPKESYIYITLTEQDDIVNCSIKDEGEGISPEVLPRVFDRFYREDASRHKGIKGTGLGLAIAKQIVDLHDGTIEIISEVGKGTEVIVSLPKEK